ncbi:MAG TPA: hypothetical protein VJ044_19610, partial [Candidatus Hodarchaeales archaeon]|nr:hypothetical protein [Candidatus Hodarchaeales archaeon]
MNSSLAYFASIYLAHYWKDETPQFHLEIYEQLQSLEQGLVEVIAFRGSGKSTIASLIFALWCAITRKRHFIVLASDTFTQSKFLISHIQNELENNQLLREDYGDLTD